MQSPQVNNSCSKLRRHFSGLPFQAASLSDRGRLREANEDALVFVPEAGFFAVVDGMGGLLAGAQAAEIVAKVMPEVVACAAVTLSGNVSPKLAGQLLADGVQQVSDKIHAGGNRGSEAVFGATFIGLWLVAGQAVCVNLGDCRAYRLTAAGGLRCLSRDHSLAGVLLNHGQISPAQARRHPGRHTVTRFVGMPPPAQPEIAVEQIGAGDRLLLCSDGLYGLVEDAAIAEIMEGGGDPENICTMLVGAANAAGGRDNISVVVVEVGA